MSRYLELLLKLMIVLMFWISLMRIRYIWMIRKTDDKEKNFVFRNQEGDWSIFFFILLVMNKSRFEHYKYSYQPILRYFYTIVIALFVVYAILQLTQFVVITRNALMTQEGTTEKSHLKNYSVKKQFYGYKFKVTIIKKEKARSLSFFTSKKNKEVIEKRFKELNVNIV